MMIGLRWCEGESSRRQWWNMVVTVVNPSTKKIEARLSFSMRTYVKQMGFGCSYEEAWGNYKRYFIFFKLQSLQRPLFFFSLR
ncbi:hypothetical protein GQ457_07G041560 [Hibiscus cannabinus]